MNSIQGNIIKKLRYFIPLENNLIAELDIYQDQLEGLMVVEVEFPSINHARNFMVPNWFGTELTENKKYKNKNLATCTSLEELNLNYPSHDILLKK